MLGGKMLPFGYMQKRSLSDSKIVNDDDSLLPVLIIGAGPVGLTLSMLLTKLGVFLDSFCLDLCVEFRFFLLFV